MTGTGKGLWLFQVGSDPGKTWNGRLRIQLIPAPSAMEELPLVPPGIPAFPVFPPFSPSLLQENLCCSRGKDKAHPGSSPESGKSNSSLEYPKYPWIPQESLKS